MIFLVVFAVTDIKPTSKPSLLKSTRLPATSVVQTTAEKTKTTAETTIKATAETTVTSRENLTSTAHAPTSLVFGVVRNTPFDDPPKNNPNSIVLIILASLAGALFGLLACSTLVFLIWRRNRYYDLLCHTKANSYFAKLKFCGTCKVPVAYLSCTCTTIKFTGKFTFFKKKSSSFQLITNQKMEFLELYVLFSGSLLQSSFDRIFHVKIN